MRLFSFFFLFSITFSAYSQNIECEKIEFLLLPTTAEDSLEEVKGDTTFIDDEEDEDDDEAEMFSLKVKALLKVSGLKNDTITMKTAVKFSPFGPRNLKAYDVDQDGHLSPLPSWVEHQSGSQFLEDIQFLKIVVPDKNEASISMEYDVIGSMPFRYSENKHFYPLQQRYDCFFPMDISIRDIEVFSQDSMKHFVSYQKENNALTDINLCFINENRYIVKPINGNKYDVNIYIPDTLSNDERIGTNINELQKYLDKLSTYLSQKEVTDIIFINWRDDKKRNAYGESFVNYIVCDINFETKGLLHEIVHSFFPYSVEKLSKGELFMRESIVEWLVLFLTGHPIDIEKQIPEYPVSLYDTHINDKTTWDLIYRKSPVFIEKIALKCGKEKMASIIFSFFNKNHDKVTNYDDFIHHLNESLSDNLVEELDSLVKASYKRTI